MCIQNKLWDCERSATHVFTKNILYFNDGINFFLPKSLLCDFQRGGWFTTDFTTDLWYFSSLCVYLTVCTCIRLFKYFSGLLKTFQDFWRFFKKYSKKSFWLKLKFFTRLQEKNCLFSTYKNWTTARLFCVCTSVSVVIGACVSRKR